MLIIISGKPGVGKTTLIKKFIKKYPRATAGFYTEEIRKNSKRIGFKVIDIKTGREAILAHVDIKTPYRVGKYRVDVEAFEKIAISALNNAKESKKPIIIDEYGKMELFSEKFKSLVKQIIKSGLNNIVLTIKEGMECELESSNIKILRFRLNRNNAEEVLSKLLEVLNF